MRVTKKTAAGSKVKKSISQELKDLGYRLPHGYTVVKRTAKKKVAPKKKATKKRTTKKP